jgi:hypothetical protein
MVACSLLTTSVVAVAVVFSESQRSWNQTYERANNNAMIESHTAAKSFEATVRRATGEIYLLDNAGQWVEVYYFQDENSPKVDRYAKFYAAGGSLMLEYGQLDPRQTLGVVPVCDGVTSCTFSAVGRCLRAQLTITDGDHTTDLLLSATPQNL